jgi:hypothetical protein
MQFVTLAWAASPNQMARANHFSGLYPLIIGGSLLFHLIYGAILGLMVGRMAELRLFSRNVIGTRIVERASSVNTYK